MRWGINQRPQGSQARETRERISATLAIVAIPTSIIVGMKLIFTHKGKPTPDYPSSPPFPDDMNLVQLNTPLTTVS